MPMWRRGLGGGPFVALVAVAACTSILGDDFAIGDPGTGGHGGAGATGGGGTTTSSSTVGSGGEGLTGPCPLGEPGICGDGRKCSVIDVGGDTGCVDAGPGAPWTTCWGDSDCRELTWCDVITGVCKPLCATEGDCAGDGRCLEARVELTQPIPGLWVCTADCHPLSTVPCDGSNGLVTCGIHNPGDGDIAFDCLASGGGGIDTVCTGQTQTSSQTECGPGLTCVFFPASGDHLCKPFCSPPGAQAQCDTGTTCNSFGGISHQGIEYGVCL